MLALLMALASPAAAVERVWQAPQVLNPDPENTWTNNPVVVRTVTGETVTAFLELPNEGWGSRVLVRVRSLDGTLLPVEELTDAPAGCVLDIATDALGNVAVSWMLPDGSAQVAVRPPGGTFGEPETVSPGFEYNHVPSLTMNARGDIGLVWKRWQGGSPDGSTNVQARVRLRGQGWGPITDLSEPEHPPYYGGVNGALTPDGDLVAVWSDNPVDQWDERPAHVRAATLFEDGTVSPVQELSTFQGWATCPQVLSDLHGRVAALWHEIYDDYCPVWGQTMLARRQAGSTEFDKPEPVPGGNVSPGELAVSEDGRIGVGFSGGYGSAGNLAVGSFEEPLELVASFGGGGKPAMAGAENGEIVFAPYAGNDVMTGRLRSDGSLAPPQDLRADCAEIYYSTLDVNDEGAAAHAALMPWTGELELTVDAPSAFAGPLSCNPEQAPGGPRTEPPPYVPPPVEEQPPPVEEQPLPPAPPPEESEPAPDRSTSPSEGTAPPQGPPPPSGPSGAAPGPQYSGGPPPPAAGPAQTGFAIVVDAVKRSGSGRKRTVKLHVRCGVACSLNAVGLLAGKGGRVVSRASSRGSAPDGGRWLKLRFKLPAGLSSSKRHKATVRVSAADAHGNVLQRDLRVGL